MMDTTTNQDNMVIKQGDGSIPAPPPSSSKVSNDTVTKGTEQAGSTGQPAPADAVQVQLTQEVEGALETAQKENDQQTQEQLQETIERLNDKLGRLNREIELKVDQRIDKNYVSVVDKQSKEVIREFPPEEIRTFIARFMEFNEKLASITDLRSLIINLEV